jgi:two-component system response regulator HydG
MTSILVVDDQRNMRITLAALLESAGYDVRQAESGEAALEAIRASVPDVVLTDLRLGGLDGIGVLRGARAIAPQTEVIVMTAYGTIESAVEAMKLGAIDYLQKPFSEDELLLKIARAVERHNLSRSVSWLASEFREHLHLDKIVGRSASMRDVLSRVVRIAPTETTVLITGESGTGKELIARALHANSKRAAKPFVSVNCAAISETLLESELFGHAKGSFTGATSARKGLLEEADGGTFFFDEIAELPLSLQAKLLRAIQEREVRRVGENKPIPIDIRICAATHQDLEIATQERRFRQDLYYRFNVARVALPPLRERREDIPELAEHFLAQATRKIGREARFDEGVVEQLTGYAFPGNIRELENIIEQAVALADDGLIRSEDTLPRGDSSRARAAQPKRESGLLRDAIDNAERAAIEDALSDASGNRELAAERLGLSVTTLWRKMRRLNVRWSGVGPPPT